MQKPPSGPETGSGGGFSFPPSRADRADVDAMTLMTRIPKRIPAALTVILGFILGIVAAGYASLWLKTGDDLLVWCLVATSVLTYGALVAFTKLSDD